MENGIPLLHGGSGATVLHPIVLVAILIAVFLMFNLSFRNVIIPLLFISMLVPASQKVVIEGLDFMILRIMIMFGWIRLMMSPERHPIKLNSIDKAVILWVIFSVVSYIFLWQTWGAFINRLGFAYNAFGIYFLFRFFIRDLEDIDQVIKVLSVISVFVAICMLIEQATGRNVFHVFGGVPEFTPIREGRLRSQGAFAHPIKAGIFGATLLPLIMTLWWGERHNKKIVLFGCVSATIIVLTSASSGPMLAYFAGILGLCMWPLRDHMRKIRWGIYFSIIALHIVMKAPVWALVGRFGVIGGSSSYHRYQLIDNFINRFGEWWLFGTKSTNHWGWFMWDVSNQYVSEGVRGGLVTFILFIVIIALCFRSIGLTIKRIKLSTLQLRFWAFGAALFALIVGFFGLLISDQTMLIWFLVVAIISLINSLSNSDKGVNSELQSQ